MRPNTLYIVVPCYNEEAVLPETARRLRQKLEELTRLGQISPSSRVLFVNDGSQDGTWMLIQALHAQCELFSGVDLSRNRGHQNALLAGLMTAKDRCDMVISMDADLQDDVEAVDGYTGQPRKYVSPKAFEAAEDKSGIWTLDVGQKFFFVKGEVIANLNFQSMNAKYDNVHRITKVDEKDYGSPGLRHFEVGGA